MQTKYIYKKLKLTMVVCFTVSGLAVFSPDAVLGQDGSRDTPSTGAYVTAEIVKKRPVAKSVKPKPKTTKVNVRRSEKPKPNVSNGNNRVYRIEDRNFPVGTPSAGTEYVQIGVTVWRVRTVANGDGENTAKEIIDGQEVASERIADDDFIADGERLYLGIESLMSGTGSYLYVINREQYADGTFGRARLIFPTLLTYDGNNRVKPGLPIVLPRAKGLPFIVNRGSATQAAETFTIILSPWKLRLPEPLGNKAMVLPSELIADWEKQYGKPMYRATLDGGVGQTRTKREQSVGNRDVTDTAELTQDDPLPQTVFRGAVKKGNPAMVTVALRFRK
jgi:hypothetical protein